MKISSWNINGIRSAEKEFLAWVKEKSPDIICLQEIKSKEDQLPESLTKIEGYHSYFNPAERKGYSGVAVYTKSKPKEVSDSLGINRFDEEGRVLKLVFDNFILFNFYIPNGARDKRDMGYKLDVYRELLKILRKFSNKPVILTGDFNIAHTELDVYHAKQNVNNTMFTPEERSQLSRLVELGYVDVFREKYPKKESYTWWPYMKGLREKNIGWRIDYFFVTKTLADKIQDIFSERETLGSDHGPLTMSLDINFDKSKPPKHKKAQEDLFN